MYVIQVLSNRKVNKMKKNPNEYSNLQNSQHDILENVNEKYEQMVKDVRELINKNDQASKME